MFKLHKNKSQKSGEKLAFNFSNFHALQVPKGWDKLSVSIVSVETGKTVAKSGKASVRNGNCRWTETLSESIWIPGDDATGVTEEYLFKFLVFMGSSRSGILGEATVNLASYMSSKTSVPLSLPLEKCNNGTILQVKVQCLTPRKKVRDYQWKDTNSQLEDVENDDIENNSDVSDGTFTRSGGSSSSNHLDGTIYPGELSSRDPSFSASGSRHSLDSMDGSFGKDNYSPQGSFLIGRQDSTGSQTGSSYGSYSFHDSARANYSSLNSKVASTVSRTQNHRDDSNRASRTVPASPLQNSGSFKDLETAEATIEELRAEAKMWEQNARKLVIDMEKLQKDLYDQSKCQESLEMELSASRTQCTGLKQEMENLKILYEESLAKETVTESMKFQAKDIDSIRKEFEEEMKFQKEENANLALQLKKTQESNIELVSILQELEETIQKQKMEIDSLSKLKSEFQVGASGLECDDARQKNSSKQDLTKVRKSSCDSDPEDSMFENSTKDLHMELELEKNSELNLQHQQLQELQKNLEGTIWYLERTLDDKNKETEVLLKKNKELEQGLTSQVLVKCETQWRDQLAEKEEKIAILEAKLFTAHDSQSLMEKGFENEGYHNLITENESLKEKVQELERDCNELTDENLELLFKLKESKKDVLTGSVCHKSSSQEDLDNVCKSGFELSKLKSQLDETERQQTKKITVKGFSADYLQVQDVDLKNKCADLEIQLGALKDKASYLDCELCKWRARAEEQENQICELQQKLECYQAKETELKVLPSDVSPDSVENSKLLSELHEQIQLTLSNAKKWCFALGSPTKSECSFRSDDSEISITTDALTQKEQIEIILKNFSQLKELLKEKTCGINNGKEVQTTVVNSVEILNELEVHTSDQGQENLNEIPDDEETNPDKELTGKISEINKLKSDNVLKEEEVEALRRCQQEYESQISNLQKEKSQLEEHVENILSEAVITSKILDDLKNEISVLTSNMDSQVSANKILERKYSELESGKNELEVQLSEIEEENVQLSERICGLEAQLRYLTDARESNRLELQNSELHAMNLKDELRKLETQMEAQKVDMKKKLQDMQNLWLEASKECEYLKIANPKLQSTAESLIDECSLLQKSNRELMMQKIELHEHCMVLEAELKESEKIYCHILKEVEIFEEKYASLLEEIDSKEKAINLELDALVHENKNHKEKLVSEESLVNQMYLEKTFEVENLQREVAHLTEQISATHDEERSTSATLLEVSSLRASKTVLEASIQEVQGRLKLSESNFTAHQMESETKIQELTGELVASKHNQEVLMADHEKLLNLLEDVKSNEEKLKTTVRGLDLKAKASEYERLQLVEEISSLNVQLQKTALLQDEILSLKRMLNEVKLENERLKASLQILSRDHEEIQAERTLFVQKISVNQNAISELENCKNRKVALEEKLLRLEGDLAAREAQGSQEAALKNELAQIRRENSRFQRKMKCLQEEKEECMRRVQALEEELKLKKTVDQDLSKSCNSVVSPYPECDCARTSTNGDCNLSMVDDNEQSLGARNSQSTEIDPLLKIQSLENELAEALEANDMYKSQLKSMLSQVPSSRLEIPMTSTIEDGVANKEGYEHKVSYLEAELRDLRERYLQMSIKYAEVEDQKEQLVLKLKAGKNRRSWFS